MNMYSIYPEAVVPVDIIWSAELSRTQHEILQTLGCVVSISLNSDLSTLFIHNTPLANDDIMMSLQQAGRYMWLAYIGSIFVYVM